MDISQILAKLKPGYFIKTQPSSINTWTISTVIQLDRDSLIVPYTPDFITSAVLRNDFVKCRFSIGENLITLMCMVEDINFGNYPTTQIKVVKADTWKNVRDSERYDVGYLCKISGTDEKIESYGIVTDLSNSGTAVICKDQISTNSNIKIKFSALNTLELDVYANVARNKKTLDYKIEYGLKFYNLTEDEKNQIDMIIRQEKLKEENAFNKFCAVYGLTPSF